MVFDLTMAYKSTIDVDHTTNLTIQLKTAEHLGIKVHACHAVVQSLISEMAEHC